MVGRLKDMVMIGGANVYSAEVENAIAQLPGMSMCAVTGVPDEHWGERVHAVIVPRPDTGLTAEAVIAHCKGLIAGYKCPRNVEFVEANRCQRRGRCSSTSCGSGIGVGWSGGSEGVWRARLTGGSLASRARRAARYASRRLGQIQESQKRFIHGL